MYQIYNLKNRSWHNFFIKVVEKNWCINENIYISKNCKDTVINILFNNNIKVVYFILIIKLFFNFVKQKAG